MMLPSPTAPWHMERTAMEGGEDEGERGQGWRTGRTMMESGEGDDGGWGG